MAYSPHAQINGSSDSSGAKKPPVGFSSFIKKIVRWLNKTKKQVVTLEAKRDIKKLEHERNKERGELLGQRRFYENLLRRGTAPLPDIAIEVNNKKVPKSAKELKIEEAKNEPAISTLDLPVPVPEKLIAPEPPQPIEAPAPKEIIQPIPSSQDIFPLASKPVPDLKQPVKPEDKPVLTSPLKSSSFEFIEKTNKPVKPAIVSQPVVPNKFIKKLSSFFVGGSLAKKLAKERQEEEAVKSKVEVEARFWQPYDGVKANLIKDQVVLFFNWRQKMLTLTLSLVLCCLAISLTYVGLLIWQKEKLNSNKTTLANFDAINAEVAKNEDEIKEITNFNKKLNIVSYLLNNHVYWTNFFTFLENNTLKDVYYVKFTGDLSGKYKVPSVARNLDTISLQLEVMKAYNMIRSIQYSSAQSASSDKTVKANINFNLEMSLDPKIFVK